MSKPWSLHGGQGGRAEVPSLCESSFPPQRQGTPTTPPPAGPGHLSWPSIGPLGSPGWEDYWDSNSDNITRRWQKLPQAQIRSRQERLSSSFLQGCLRPFPHRLFHWLLLSLQILTPAVSSACAGLSPKFPGGWFFPVSECSSGAPSRGPPSSLPPGHPSLPPYPAFLSFWH